MKNMDTHQTTLPPPQLARAIQSWHLLVVIVIGVMAVAVANGVVQFSTAAICCGDYDGYYHTRFSQLLWQSIWQGGFPAKLQALPLTTWRAEVFSDHHFLFHLFLGPFIAWLGDFDGARVATWLLACGALLACFALILRCRLRYPLLWLFLLIGGAELFRLNMTKAISLTIILMVLAIFVLFERRYHWLAPIAFAYVWAHNSWIMLVLLVGLWVITLVWVERPKSLRTLAWQPLLFMGLGLVFGNIVNPFFPDNILLSYEHARMRLFSPIDANVEVGGEWYSPPAKNFITQMLIGSLSVGAGLLALNIRDRSSPRPIFLMAFALVLMLMTAISQRFNEYFSIFAVLFLAFTLAPRLAGLRRMFYWSDADRRTQPLPPAREDAMRMGKTLSVGWKELPVFVLMAIAMTAASVQPIAKIQFLRELPTQQRYAAALRWANQNMADGELVFDDRWSDFGLLYYHTPNLKWVSGLDPYYIINYKPDLGIAYERIVKGDEPNPAQVIRQQFGVRYVFIAKPAPFQLEAIANKPKLARTFVGQAASDKAFKLAYEDDDCLIYRLE